MKEPPRILSCFLIQVFVFICDFLEAGVFIGQTQRVALFALLTLGYCRIVSSVDFALVFRSSRCGLVTMLTACPWPQTLAIFATASIWSPMCFCGALIRFISFPSQRLKNYGSCCHPQVQRESTVIAPCIKIQKWFPADISRPYSYSFLWADVLRRNDY